MRQAFTESVVEQAALDWLAGLGWQTAFGPEIVDSERGGDFGRVVLEGRLRQAIARLRGHPERFVGNFAIMREGGTERSAALVPA